MFPQILFPIIIAVAAATPSFGAEAVRLDLTAIHTISISGDSSAIHIRAADEAPHEARIEGVRHGWFSGWSSSWFGTTCPQTGSMRVDGDTLYIRAEDATLFGFTNCSARIDVATGRDVAVTIDQPAAQVRLDGDYSNVTLKVHAADFSFDGHARAMAISSNAMRSDLTFTRVEQNETLTIDSQSLDAFVNFGGAAPLDYQVVARASLVDAARASVPGVLPRIRIQSKFVRATIR